MVNVVSLRENGQRWCLKYVKLICGRILHGPGSKWWWWETPVAVALDHLACNWNLDHICSIAVQATLSRVRSSELSWQVEPLSSSWGLCLSQRHRPPEGQHCCPCLRHRQWGLCCEAGRTTVFRMLLGCTLQCRHTCTYICSSLADRFSICFSFSSSFSSPLCPFTKLA